jgi:predicted metalloenzyme YecM
MPVNSTSTQATQQDTKPSKELESPQRKRLNLDLALPAFELLQKLCKATDKNMAEVLRTGLALYGIAYEAQINGKSIGIIEKDKVVKEIIIT